MAGIYSWPGLIGYPVDQVVEIIQQENPELNVVKLPKTTPKTTDYQLGRVRVFYDEHGNVDSEPRTG